MRVYAVGSAVAVGVAFVLLASCREPTEVTLELSTDLSCSSADPDPLDKTSIYVGTPQELAGPLSGLTPAAVTRGCMDGKEGRIGSIVLVPSGSDDERFSLRVVAGRRSSDCAKNLLSGCIEARRTLGFVPHTPLFLPLALNKTCENVVCPNAGDTCVEGACVPSDIVCSGDCTTPSLDAGVHDATSIVDAIVPKDAISVLDVGLDDAIAPLDASWVDANKGCNPGSFLDGGAATYTWHFDEGSGTSTTEPTLGTVVLPAGATWVSGPSGCNFALALPAPSSVTLGTSAALGSASFRVAFWMKSPPKSDTAILAVADANSQKPLWSVFVQGGYLAASVCYSNCALISSTAVVTDGAWHSVGFAHVANGGATVLVVDGVPVGTPTQGLLSAAASATLTLGLAGAIDELSFLAN